MTSQRLSRIIFPEYYVWQRQSISTILTALKITSISVPDFVLLKLAILLKGRRQRYFMLLEQLYLRLIEK